jgi:hypothetical protein
MDQFKPFDYIETGGASGQVKTFEYTAVSKVNNNPINGRIEWPLCEAPSSAVDGEFYAIKITTNNDEDSYVTAKVIDGTLVAYYA